MDEGRDDLRVLSASGPRVQFYLQGSIPTNAPKASASGIHHLSNHQNLSDEKNGTFLKPNKNPFRN